MFSPWEYNVDKAAARLLAPTGWNSPDPQVYPTGAELLERYIEPLATKTALRDVIRTSSRVTAVGRAGFDKAKTKGRETAPFEIRYQNGKGPETLRADAVIDASGTWGSPNPAGAGGLTAIGEREAAARISYGMPDVLGKERARFAGKTVAVLGAGHSAIGTLTDLTTLAQQAPGTRPIWLLRGTDPAKAFGGGANDKLAARGELGAHFASLVGSGQVQVEAGFSVAVISQTDGRLRIATSSACCGRSIVVDELVVATGFRPDLSFLGEIRLRLDPAIEAPVALAPLIDPNEHSCGTVRPHGARELVQDDPGFYLAGIKSLRPCADFPDDHGLRTGSLHRRRHRRRQGSRRAGGARASGDGCLHARRRGRRSLGRVLRRPGAGRRRGVLRRRRVGEGGGQVRLRLFLMDRVDRGRLGSSQRWALPRRWRGDRATICRPSWPIRSRTTSGSRATGSLPRSRRRW